VFAHVPDRPVKEAGAYRTVGFDDGGDPRRVAGRRLRLLEAQMGAKMPHDAAEFFRRFDDESAAALFRDERLDLRFEDAKLVHRQGDRGLALGRPASWPVERLRGNVRSEERNGLKIDLARGLYGLAELREISPLDRGARSHRIAGAARVQRPHACGKHIECAGHAANRVVKRGRTVERNNHVVDGFADLFRVPPDQQTRA